MSRPGSTNRGILAVPVAEPLKRADEDQRIVETERAMVCGRLRPPDGFAGMLSRAARRGHVTDEPGAVRRSATRRAGRGRHPQPEITFPSDLSHRPKESLAIRADENRQGSDRPRARRGRKLIIGGSPFPSAGLAASDADVLVHAGVATALRAAALGDIGRHFPITDAKYADADSRAFLRESWRRFAAAGLRDRQPGRDPPCEAPKIGAAHRRLIANLASDLGLPVGCVNVKQDAERSAPSARRPRASLPRPSCCCVPQLSAERRAPAFFGPVARESARAPSRHWSRELHALCGGRAPPRKTCT